MISIIQKIKKRYSKFKVYPLTKNQPLKALTRYLKFNLFTYFNNKSRIYNWINGLKFYAQKGDAGIVPNIYFKLFDYEDSMFIINSINQNDVFVDVGANVGHYSMLAAKNKAKVFAFEPVKNTFCKLEKNIKLNNLQDNVVLYNLGVGNKNETLEFITDKDVMNSVATNVSPKNEQIEVVQLDHKLNGINPTMLKIDVEGYEWFVLEGAKNILSSNELKYILIEFNNSGNKFGKEDVLIHEILIKYGFHPYRYNVENGTLEKIASYREDKFNTLYQKVNV